MKFKKIPKKILLTILVMAFCIPIVSYAAANSGVSGLAVAKYKLEGAEKKAWTNLPISTTSNQNSKSISITTPGTTIVTLYAEDKAGNQNYDIQTFSMNKGDESAPIKSIQYKLTGSVEKNWTNYTGPFDITEEGVTTVQAKITDEAGNITNLKQTIKLDKTKPVNAKATITLD